MVAPKDPENPILKSMDRVLEHHRRRRGHSAHRGQPKATRAKGEFNKKTARAIEIAINRHDQQAIDLAVTKEAQRHGDYQLVNFKMQEVVEGGKVKSKESRVIRNLGGSPIERWHQRGRLDKRQMDAISVYQSSWALHIGEPRITANYEPSISGKGAIELWASSRLHAKELLRLLDQEVFFREPVEHFEVWQNVVIWDEPAGIAGGRIGFCHKPAEAVAQLIIGTLAHKIANIVIDSSRRDFGDLLLDLDAARRPGKRSA